MFWFAAAVVVLILALAGIWFLQRFYAKATLNSALVRTGLGGRRVVVSGGCFFLPIIHRVQRVNMSAVSLTISRTGREALMTEDQLRADFDMKFEFQVQPTEEGISAAAQSFGAKIERDGEGIKQIVSGFLIAAMQTAAAGRKLAALHTDRASLTGEIEASVVPKAAQFGLTLISASILRIDQSDLSQLDERNAFDAEGMRKHAELVSKQRRERVLIETETDIAIRENALAKHRRQLEIQQTEREAAVAQQEAIELLEAQSKSNTEKAKSSAKFETERSRIESEQKIKAAQIANDEELRRTEMTAILSLEESKIENDAHLTKLRTAEFKTKATEEAARAQVILAAEDVQAKKDLAITRREHETEQARLKKELELSTLQVKSDAETLATKTMAEAEAKQKLAEAELAKAQAEAKARSAMITAENSMDPALIAMRLEERRLDRLPDIMTQMMKPVEKIDSIKINHIGGLGNNATPGNEGGADSAFGSAMDQVLGMAVRLPAMKQMGEEIGLDFDPNLAGRTADYANRLRAKDPKDPKK